MYTNSLARSHIHKGSGDGTGGGGGGLLIHHITHTHTLKYECYKSPILFSFAGWLVGSMVGAILRPISECTERVREQVTNNQKRKKLLARSFVRSLFRWLTNTRATKMKKTN